MPSATLVERGVDTAADPDGREQPFWRLAKASWRQLAGGFKEAGFSFEWHEVDAAKTIRWAESFHANSVEICLNLQGPAWVASNGVRAEFAGDTAGFFSCGSRSLAAERLAGHYHRFLSLEYEVGFLRSRLGSHRTHLHPVIRDLFRSDSEPVSAVSGVAPLTYRHRELLDSLLRPPVLASAQRLWYEVKALEFATEFFFVASEGEPLCTRAQRLAAERVARTKAILLEHLAEPPSLEELGKRVGCSHFYLSRTFTRETGLTISQWLRRARLERAAELLRTGRCNVTEAAFDVGYSSLSHFSEAFREMYGCCPGLYPVRTATQQSVGLKPCCGNGSSARAVR
jgi:AraC-like DNA-binding protein